MASDEVAASYGEPTYGEASYGGAFDGISTRQDRVVFASIDISADARAAVTIPADGAASFGISADGTLNLLRPSTRVIQTAPTSKRGKTGLSHTGLN